MARRPNILWILTTQWRGDALGFSGDPNARTPYLDRLAAVSTWYRQAVTPHPFGPFARAALLTGIASPENGVSDYFDPLPADRRTVAHDLNELGYHTAFFGKWHLAERDPSAPLVGEAHARTIVPDRQRGGFRFWEGFESGFLLNEPWLHGTRLAEPTPFRGYQSNVVCSRATDYLASLPGAPPVFCVVSLESPHPPYDAPAANHDRPAPAALTLPGNVPRGGECERRARRELSGYYAHIEATDRAVGRMLEKLGALGGAANWTVVFTSVHGDMHGAHGLFRKGWPYEESVRVPLLISRVGDSRAHPRISSDPVSLVDLRAATHSWAQGADDSGLLKTHARISMPTVVELPHQCDRSWRGVRTVGSKLVLNPDGTPWLFFDLSRDPLELENRVTDPSRQAQIEGLRALV